MSKAEAEALALFVKDHDTRYSPKAVGEGSEAALQLTNKKGEPLEPLRTIAEYERQFIAAENSTPTIRAAWEKWKPSSHG